MRRSAQDPTTAAPKRSVLGAEVRLFRDHLSLERRLGENTVRAAFSLAVLALYGF